MIELTDQQQQALEEAKDMPRALNPRTNETFVLVPEQLYQRMKSVLDDDLDPQQVGMLVDETMREYDADDPLLESYQKYRA
jgi:hypothetical protein